MRHGGLGGSEANEKTVTSAVVLEGGATRELGVGEARCGRAGRRRRVGAGWSGVGGRAVGRGRVPSWWAGIGP